METAHRRIDLQSPADLAHLERAASAAAAAKLDLHLPPSTAGGEDELRVAVESLVNEFVARTWRGARMSVSVNGIDLPATEGGEGGDGKDRAVGVEDLEPYDARLAARIRDLESRRDGLVERVAALRRQAPRKAAEQFESAVAMEIESGAVQAEGMAGAEARGREEGERVLLIEGEGEGAMARWGEVREMWERGEKGLRDVNEGLGETVGRLERAVGVVEYLEGRRRK